MDMQIVTEQGKTIEFNKEKYTVIKLQDIVVVL